MPKRNDSGKATSRARRERKPKAAAVAPQEEELSAYELLERRSLELTDERAHGGFGTSQPPNAAVPLLYPKPPANRPTDAASPVDPPKQRKRTRTAKPKR